MVSQLHRYHDQWNFGGWDWARPGNYYDHSPSGNRAVIRQTPVLDPSGRPRLQRVTKELDSSRLGPVSGLLGGAAVGAGVGLAAGVAGSILTRVMVQNTSQ